MIETKSFAAFNEKSELQPHQFFRQDPKGNEVCIEILFCGVCHADLHQSKNEFGRTSYPFVPGHEIIGQVVSSGIMAKKFKTGDWVGVGYIRDSCGECPSCITKEVQFCENGPTPTQGGMLSDGTYSKGGYSNYIVVSEDFALTIPTTLKVPAAAPLLCAGVTVYSTIKHYEIFKSGHVAILGFGGLGHLAAKFLNSMGINFSILSHSESKKDLAFELGATNFIVTTDKLELKKQIGKFDFIIDSISAKHEIAQFIKLLKRDGTLVLLGSTKAIPSFSPSLLIGQRKKIGGSFIGSITETQEMLDYCAEKSILPEINIIHPKEINYAFKRLESGDITFRFVMDLSKLD